ncbi:MAG: DedA family protein [Candidatus Nealsonbacteria bacterium]|nr:DedA family protein [Candidatus Nealsonbacteria bacterium]
MIYDFLALISSFVVNIISTLGYGGIFFLMALESALIPIPSEIIMPFSGFLVFEEKFSFLSVVLWGTIGNLIGSIAAYLVGLYGGRPLIEKYGKFILISHRELDLADSWFKKYGSLSVLVSRMLPAVRTFISLPAGIARMPFGKFCFYTFLGSLPWSFALTYAGIVSGGNWRILEPYFRKFDWAIGILGILLIGWFIYYKVRNNKKYETLNRS